MALPSHKNRVGMSVSSVASAGTGTYTLNAALSNHQSFATAYGANATVDTVAVEDGVGWEVAREATYTHSGTTLSRGTLEASSTGSAVAFSSAVKVYVTPTATRQNLIQSHGLFDQASNAPTTGNVTGVVGTLHLVDISGITAARNFELPSTFAAGDRVGVLITATHATVGRELVLTAASGDTLMGVAGGTEWSRIWQVGELLIFRATADNATWVIERDGRIPQQGRLRVTTAGTTNTGATLTSPSSMGGYAGTADVAIGCDVSTSTWTITVRRTGRYNVSGFWITNANVNATSELLVSLTAGGTTVAQFRMVTGGSAALGGVACASAGAPISAAGTLTFQLRTTGTDNTGCGVSTNTGLMEVL